MAKKVLAAEAAAAEETGGNTEQAETGRTQEETGGTTEQAETGRTQEETGGTTEQAETGGAQEETGGNTEQAERIRLVYIGPSLTFEKLRTSQILLGTKEEIGQFMAPIVEKYPEAAFLLVTPEALPDAMEKVGSKTSILHKYYEDMLAKSRDIRKG